MLKHTKFEIKLLESDFYCPTPLPSAISWADINFSGTRQYQFLRLESQNGLIFNLTVANINFPCVLKRSCMEKFGQFPSAEQLFFFQYKILLGKW